MMYMTGSAGGAQLRELTGLFRRNFSWAVRSDAAVTAVLGHAANTVLEWRECGQLMGAAVVRDDAVLLLCVDERARGRGIGSALLARCESLVRARGFADVRVGAGADYLLPGVPSPDACGTLGDGADTDTEAALRARVDAGARRFFERRGYEHAWGDCECFDMCAELGASDDAGAAVLDGALGGAAVPEGLRWAGPDDRTAVLDCVRAAHGPFARYYEPTELYARGARRVLLAGDAAGVAGALIAACGQDAPGVGGLACVAVAPERRGRGLARALVCAATGALRTAGMVRGFIGYTYSGLERLYGAAGYRVYMRYFMAEKHLLAAHRPAGNDKTI